MLENRILGIQQLFNVLNWKCDFDPILGAAIFELVSGDTAVLEPLVDLR